MVDIVLAVAGVIYPVLAKLPRQSLAAPHLQRVVLPDDGYVLGRFASLIRWRPIDTLVKGSF